MAPEASRIFYTENLPSGVSESFFLSSDSVRLLHDAEEFFPECLWDTMFYQLVINNVDTDSKHKRVAKFISDFSFLLQLKKKMNLIKLADIQKDNLDMVHCRYIVVRPDSAVEEVSQTGLTVWYMVDDHSFATTWAYKRMLDAKSTEATQGSTMQSPVTPQGSTMQSPVTPQGTLQGTVYSLKLTGKRVCHPDDPTLKKYVWLGNIDANFRGNDRQSGNEYFAYQGHRLVKCMLPQSEICKNPVAQAIHAALENQKYKLSGLYLLSDRTDPVVRDDSKDSQEVTLFSLYEYDLSPYVVLSSNVSGSYVYEHDGKIVSSSVPGILAHFGEVSGMGIKYSKFVCSSPAIEIRHIVA